MLCQKCNKNTATVHYKQVINGQKTEQHLCQQCAKEENLDFNFNLFDMNPFTFNPFDFGSLFQSATAPMLGEDKSCPVCGMTGWELERGGRLGCSECANTFEGLLGPILKQIHGSTSHTGKLSKAIAAETKTDSVLEKLQADLKAAVEREDYETAAKLRDKIKEMKGE